MLALNRSLLSTEYILMNVPKSLASIICMKLKLNYDRQSVGQSGLVSGAHPGPATNFSFSLKFPLDNCVFVIL
jgi:hypothetical protein